MIHFFKQTKTHLDCFTTSPQIITTAPVAEGVKFLPEWWRKLPTHTYLPGFLTPQTTMKKCHGMFELYAKSVVMPLWSDLSIVVHPDKSYSWQFSDTLSSGSEHNSHQFDGFVDKHTHSVFKLHSPWLFSCKSNIDWVVTQASYSSKNFSGYTIMPGILNFNRQFDTNSQLLLDLKVPNTITLSVGQPLVHFLPMVDKKVVIHRHLISAEEHARKSDSMRPISFIGKYKKITQLKQRFSTCPFKDHTGDTK